jgi:hypothetical protein
MEGYAVVAHRFVHHLADIGEASTAFRILFRTLAATSLFLVHDALKDGGSSIIANVLFDIIGTVAKAVTN